MPNYPHLRQYREALKNLVDYGGSHNELNIRPAFQNCLAAYCQDHPERLVLVPELRGPGGIPDGTIKDSLRMPRGHWEAKDSQDNLDAEIQAKFARGYPQNNILFEDSQTAVLIQNQEEAMRVDMTRFEELHRLIIRFLDYELPEIEEFRRARQQFKADLPAVLENLRQAVAEAEKTNAAYRAAAKRFLDLCQETIGPAVTDADVREMLLQHILTQDIFLRIFAEDQFHRENNVARQLTALEETFFTGDVRRDAIDRLRTYYGAIGRAADTITDYAEKQQFLKAIYEDFYQAYNPAAADRLGVVYTPNEVVDFILRGADFLLQKHFGKTLADDNVQILDPATGTGTFITNLINYLPDHRLEYKYLKEIHANEVAILPYYIANLNIEYSYKERTGRYLEFPNLCFVDTLDNLDWQGAAGGAVERQSTFNLGALSEENWIRIQEQNDKTISVIVGNPPYNANQRNENENNPNRPYPEIDRRIRETYVAASAAQKTKQYDMYKRFLRWASDRLADDGVIAFITNRAYLEARQDDGFRKVALDEFSDLYIVDLGGDIRKSGRVGNIFGIMTGVAIGFLVRCPRAGPGAVHYYALADEQSGPDKLSVLQQLNIATINFEDRSPDASNSWLNQSSSDFPTLPPLANRETKLAKTADDETAVFGLYSLGVVTNRDDWVYDFDADRLGRKVRVLINEYEETRAEYGGKDIAADSLGGKIKWTRDLKRQLLRDSPNIFDRALVRPSLYRPFVGKYLYFSQNLNEMQYQLPQILPPPHGQEADNQVINFCVNGKYFYALAADRLVDLHFTGDTQCLPLYRYTSGGRVSNITEGGLRRFRERYGDATIGPEEIFAYTYAMLHDPVYLEEYAVDLRREFPRVRFHADFWRWARWGERLLAWHIGFEQAEPWPLERREAATPSPAGKGGGRAGAPRAILRADPPAGNIILDGQTILAGVPPEAWEYRLGSRSALEWVLDQYKERAPKDPTIRERFNTYRFADYKERVIDLLGRVCRVSVETRAIVAQMAAEQPLA